MSQPATDATGVGRFLAELWDEPVEVRDVRAASAGARRRNVLFTAGSPSRQLRLVATIMPTLDLQIIPIGIEAATIQLAERAGVPVAPVLGWSEDDQYVDGPFFVSMAVDGETVPRRVLRLVDQQPGLGPELARQCGAALATLHAIDTSRCPVGITAVAPGASPVVDALAGLRAQMDTLLLQPSAAFELGLRWLSEHQPRDDRVCLVHNDFRNGNIVVGPEGLRAALDWEASRLGAPMADLAWMCVRMWRFGNDDRPVGGFGATADLRAGYEAAGGTWDAGSFHWWKVLSSLRWGLGLANQARQHLGHEFRSIVMAASGRRIAELEYDVLCLVGTAPR